MKLFRMLLVLVLAGMLALLGVGVAGLLSQSRLLELVHEQADISTLNQRHMRVDMLHDAVRGDVLAALLAAERRDSQGLQQARAQLTEHSTEFREALHSIEILATEAELRAQLEALEPQLDTYLKQSAAVVGGVTLGKAPPVAVIAQFEAAFVDLEGAMAAASDAIAAWADRGTAHAQQVATFVHWLQWGGMALGAAVLIALGTGTVRRIMTMIGGEPQLAVEAARRIAGGDLQTPIVATVGRDPHSLLASMQRMQADLRARSERDAALAAESLRIRTALDCVSTNVMIADADFRIIYVNQPLQRMLAEAEPSLRQDLPRFDSKALIGSSIDVFHRHPEHQRRLLDGLRGTHQARVRVGGHLMQLIINPVRDGAGQLNGYVVEWSDRTQEEQVENEIAGIIRGAVDGNLQLRVAVAGKQSFFKVLAEQINQLLDTTSASLGEISAMLQALAKGQLGYRIRADLRGSFGQMRDDANQTASHLADIVARIQSAAASIDVSASEVAAGSNDLAARTEQQASSLEQTASSMEEMTSTVQQNADRTQQANQLGRDASHIASSGGAVVADVVVTMQDIDRSSRKIGEIISVIDGIAFQTNILALNAAVEAARAGEQGRGFAVVASEVRSLAQRSSAAAREIKSLIEDSMQRVSDGSQLVSRAGSTMQDIVAAVERLTGLIGEIANASQEQASGIQQINLAVVHMDQATQQNAALVEQSTAAAQSMAERASELAQLVSTFQLDAAAAPRVRAAA